MFRFFKRAQTRSNQAPQTAWERRENLRAARAHDKAERIQKRRDIKRWFGSWLRAVTANAWRTSRWGWLFCGCVAAMIWLVPTLREAMHAQIFGSTLIVDNWTPFSRLDRKKWSFRRLSARYPNDIRVLAQVPNEPQSTLDEDGNDVTPVMIFPNNNGNSQPFNRTIIRQYDALLKRFPNTIWLLAMRCNRTRREMRDWRIVVHETWEYDPSAPYSYYGGNNEASPQKPNYKLPDAFAAIAAVRRGQRLEPDNAYWDWLLASFLFSIRRDKECFQTLAQGARKARYEDHYLDILRARVEALEHVRPLFLEEKLNVFAVDAFADRAGAAFTKSLWDTQISRFGAAPTKKLWSRAERWWKSAAGQRALSMQSDVARIAALRLRGRTPLYNGAADGIWLPQIWYGARDWLTASERKIINATILEQRESVLSRLKAERFAALARRLGRADIADAVPAQQALAQARAKQYPRTYRRRPGVPDSIRARNATYWILGFVLLMQFIASSVIWCALSLLLLRSKPMPEAAATWWKSRSFFVIAASALGSMALIALAIYGNTGHLIVGDYLSTSTPAQTRLQNWAIAAMVAAMTLWAAPCLFGAWFSWLISVWSVWRERKVLWAPTPPQYDGESARIVPPNRLPWMASFVTWGIVSYAVAAWLLALLAWLSGAKSWSLPIAIWNRNIWVNTPEPWPYCVMAGIFITLFCWFAWPFKWRFAAGERWHGRAHAALHLYRRALGWSFVVGCACYFGLALARVQVDRSGSRAFENYLKYGQNSVLKK